MSDRTEYMREWGRRRAPRYGGVIPRRLNGATYVPRGDLGGLLPVSCWCERMLVFATCEEVRNGITHSCDNNRKCKDQRATETRQGNPVTRQTKGSMP